MLQKCNRKLTPFLASLLLKGGQGGSKLTSLPRALQNERMATPPSAGEAERYIYHFDFGPQVQKSFEVALAKDSLEVVRAADKPKPDWTKLDCNQCSNCPLKAESTPYCPVALNLSDMVNFFSEHTSVEKLNIRVEAPGRSYFKTTVLQDGIQSIYGLIMATSGCPHMNFLKPMAHFHLPFSQFKETVARTVALYLLKQHYLLEKNQIQAVDLKELEKKYSAVNQVNQGIAARFRQIKMRDSSKNGIVILDSFATMVPWELSGNFKNFGYLFELKNTHEL